MRTRIYYIKFHTEYPKLIKNTFHKKPKHSIILGTTQANSLQINFPILDSFIDVDTKWVCPFIRPYIKSTLRRKSDLED